MTTPRSPQSAPAARPGTAGTPSSREQLRAPEVRTYPALRLEVRDVETDQALTSLHGRAVPYGERINVGWYDETVLPGAFSKSIREAARDLPLLLWHDSHSWSVGRAVEWDDNSAGLDCVWELDDSDIAQRAARQARDGFMTGLSVGFQPMPHGSRWSFVDADTYDPENGIVDHVERQEARLLEVSLTPTPAYAGAGVSLVRSAHLPDEVRAHRRAASRPGELDDWRATLAALRDAGPRP